MLSKDEDALEEGALEETETDTRPHLEKTATQKEEENMVGPAQERAGNCTRRFTTTKGMMDFR